MRTSLILVFITASACLAVTGRIVNELYQPVPMVSLSYKGSAEQSLTDGDGVFDFSEGPTKLSSTPANSVMHPTMRTSSQMLSWEFTATGEIGFGLPFAHEVSLTISDLQGRQLYQHTRFLSAGNHLFQVPEEIKHSKTPRVIRLQITENHLNSESFPPKSGKTDQIAFAANHKLSRWLARRSAAGIDTLVLQKTNYSWLQIPILSYEEDLGTIIMPSASLPAGDFFQFIIDSTATQNPHQVDAWFYALDGAQKGITGLHDCLSSGLCELWVDDVAATADYEAKLSQSWKESGQILTLLLDIGSVLGTEGLAQLKSSVKDYIRLQHISTQIVRVYTFSSTVNDLGGFTDTTALFEAIDDIQLYGSSTNLHGALAEALNQTPAADVILAFTDGPDTQGSIDADSVLSLVNQQDIYIIAGHWSSWDLNSMHSIAGEMVYPAETSSDIQSQFRQALADRITKEHSWYHLQFQSPHRGDVDHEVVWKVPDNTNTDSLSELVFTYNSVDFTDGYAPEVSVMIETENDSIKAVATYFDADNDPEGDTQIYWQKTTNLSNWSYYYNEGYWKVPLDTSKNISYRAIVTPCQQLGTPLCGDSVVATWHFWRPEARNISIPGTIIVGDTVQVSWEYYDANGDEEGVSLIQWYLNDTPIPGETGNQYIVQPEDYGQYLSYHITPMANSVVASAGSDTSSQKIRVYENAVYDSYYDQRYPVIQIGPLTWTAQGIRAARPSSCTGSCNTFGSYLTFYEAMGTDMWDYVPGQTYRGVCPAGWHVPSETEWDVLIQYVQDQNNFPSGMDSTGHYLKSELSWGDYPGNDDVLLNLLPGGSSYTNGRSSSLHAVLLEGWWWTSSINSVTDRGKAKAIIPVSSVVVSAEEERTDAKMNLRCVQDY